MSDADATEREESTTWLDTADSVIDRNLARDETVEFTAEDLETRSTFQRSSSRARRRPSG